MDREKLKREKTRLRSSVEDGAYLAVKMTVFTALFGGALYAAWRARGYIKNRTKPKYIDPVEFHCSRSDENTQRYKMS